MGAMPTVLCPSCHRTMLASDYLLCDEQQGSHFLQCPACDACIPVFSTEHHEVPLELAAA